MIERAVEVHSSGNRELPECGQNNLAKKFLRAVVSYEVHTEIAHSSYGYWKAEWIRNMRMLADYVTSDKTYAELGQQYGLRSDNNRQKTNRVYLRLRRTMQKLWNQSPQFIKNEFGEIPSITYKRPISERSREKMILAKNGIRSIALALALNGKSRKEIAVETGAKSSKITSALYEERRRGKLPVSRMIESRLAFEKLNNFNLSFEEKQTALDKLSQSKLDDKSKIVSFRYFCRELGLGFVRSSEISSCLLELKKLGCASRVEVESNGDRKIYLLKSDLERLRLGIKASTNGHL